MPTLRHHLEYSAKTVPLELVIGSLTAQQKLLTEAVAALERACVGSELRIVSIEVETIASGSLSIDLVLQLYSNYQKSIDSDVSKTIESLTGVHVPKDLETVVSLFLFGATYYVARWVYDAVKSKSKQTPPPHHIEGDYNQIITIIANKIAISREDVDQAISTTIPPLRARQLAKTVSAIFRPAKRDVGSTISVPDFAASPNSIREFPNDADLTDIEENVNVSVPNALIDIRALDRDRNKHGWAAKILNDAEYGSERLPMDLYPTVDAAHLARLDRVRADLVLEMTRSASGDMRARKIHLLNFKETDE